MTTPLFLSNLCHHQLNTPPFSPTLPLLPQVDFKRQKEGNIGDRAEEEECINVAVGTGDDAPTENNIAAADATIITTRMRG